MLTQLFDGSIRETDDHEHWYCEQSNEHAQPLVHLLAGLLLLLVMVDYVVLPVCGQVDVEVHQVVGKDPE